MRVHFLGDEVSAVGFRLAGAVVSLPADGGLWLQIESFREECELLLITAELAQQLEEKQRQQLMRSHQPLVLIIPDIRQQTQPDDVIEPIRRRLGIRKSLFSVEN